MDYYVSKQSGSVEAGTAAQPFSTVSQAAAVARPGDTVWIGAGVYREWVRPARGGSGDDCRIVYRSMPGERAVISGAECLEGWTSCGDGVWKTSIPAAVLADYNPYADVVYGDWYHDGGQDHHTGEIFLDDKALYEAPDLAHIRQPSDRRNWFAEVSELETTVWVYLPDENPNEHRMEASVRPACFFPEQEGLNFITVSGLVIEKAATQWAPPSAFQSGAIGPHWSKGWIIENCVIRCAKCSGVSLGKRRDVRDSLVCLHRTPKNGTQIQTELMFTNINRDWSKENVGSHIIRNNEIYDCGQAGVVGCMGAAFSVVTGNHIHDINNREEFGGSEMAGIKFHAAIDVRLENNLIHDCRRSGVWLDWEAQGVRVSRNVFFANQVEDLFIEVSHGPCTVDNNVFLSPSGFRNVSQGTAVVHNLFAGEILPLPDLDRYTMYHIPHDTAVQGVVIIYGGDDRLIGNIFLGENSGTAVYNGYPDQASKQDTPESSEKAPLPVCIRDNLYFNNAKAYELESGAVTVDDFEASVRAVCQDGQWFLETNLPEYAFDNRLPLVTTETLGQSFQAEAAYENPDGTAFAIELDFTGAARGEQTIPGPFAAPMTRIPLNP